MNILRGTWMILYINVHNVIRPLLLRSLELSMFEENTVLVTDATSILRGLSPYSKGAIKKSDASPKQCLWYLGQVHHSHSCGGRNLGSPQWCAHNVFLTFQCHK